MSENKTLQPASQICPTDNNESSLSPGITDAVFEASGSSISFGSTILSVECSCWWFGRTIATGLCSISVDPGRMSLK